MANRHLGRSIALQTLFEWDFRQLSKDDLDALLKRNVEEFAPGASDNSFIENLVKHVVEKQVDLDAIVTKAAPEWPIDKISNIDRNVLRIGLYELLFAPHDEVPPKVAINEAIEIAKSFGGETSSKFVNGVLGAVYKEMGEPGKDDGPKEKKPPIKEDLVGAVVYAKDKGEIKVALVHDIFGHWTLTKGHMPEGVTDLKEGLKQAVQDELGIDVSVKQEIGENEYGTYDPDKGKLKKHVTYFLAETPYKKLSLKESGGLDNAKWFPIEELAELNFYDDMMPIVTKAVEELAKED